MAQFLDYSPRPHWHYVAKRLVRVLPLALGAAIYTLFCIPAATRPARPVGDAWKLATCLWVFPVPLFVRLWSPGWSSNAILAIYAILTGYIDARTVEWVLLPLCFLSGTLPISLFVIAVHLISVSMIARFSRFMISWKMLRG